MWKGSRSARNVETSPCMNGKVPGGERGSFCRGSALITTSIKQHRSLADLQDTKRELRDRPTRLPNKNIIFGYSDLEAHDQGS